MITVDYVYDRAQALGSKLVARGNEYIGSCPNPDHPDRHPSFTLAEGPNKVALFKCHSRCTQDQLCSALGIIPGDKGGISHYQQNNRTAERSVTVKAERPTNDAPPMIGCTLEQYAEHVGIPSDILTSWGLCQYTKAGNPVVQIPYYLLSGEPNDKAVRQRIALEGTRRFEWRKGSKATLYGLELQQTAIEKGNVVACAIALSLDKPFEWAVGFFFGNPELSCELWNIISGISGMDFD